MAEEIKSNEPDTTSLIDKALAAANRQEAANAELKTLLDRQERINAIKLLGGRSEAGQAPVPVISEEERIKAETRLLFKGTQIEKAIK